MTNRIRQRAALQGRFLGRSKAMKFYSPFPLYALICWLAYPTEFEKKHSMVLWKIGSLCHGFWLYLLGLQSFPPYYNSFSCYRCGLISRSITVERCYETAREQLPESDNRKALVKQRTSAFTTKCYEKAFYYPTVLQWDSSGWLSPGRGPSCSGQIQTDVHKVGRHEKVEHPASVG